MLAMNSVLSKSVLCLVSAKCSATIDRCFSVIIVFNVFGFETGGHKDIRTGSAAHPGVVYAWRI
jgi:hypothetical protein